MAGDSKWLQYLYCVLMIIKALSSIVKEKKLDLKAMRVDINYMESILRNTNMLQLNNMLLNNNWITEEIKYEKKYT